ncbi:MAG: hypothetical protein MUC88_20415 [Planctomycetes bacterium]|jgi:hypothetical protein|nr:hypothetical protein [Planctomycetota bacterium]
MGVSMDDINRGVLEAGKVLAAGMEAWNTVARNPPSMSTGGIVATAPAGGGVSNQPQGVTPAKTGLAALPGWVVGLGIVVLLWRLR